ncbi:MAG: hypothetical protein M1820_004375 [Bogoriella megaspora]|nr:MAG: hypothetical protein M1820_004375 [Bogoriella megaspora]
MSLKGPGLSVASPNCQYRTLQLRKARLILVGPDPARRGGPSHRGQKRRYEDGVYSGPSMIQTQAPDKVLFVWISGMLDGAGDCHMGAPATVMEHLKEIDARRAWHGLPQIGCDDTTIVYTGSDFNWYLRPGANLEYVLERIGETSLTRANEFSLRSDPT